MEQNRSREALNILKAIQDDHPEFKNIEEVKKIISILEKQEVAVN